MSEQEPTGIEKRLSPEQEQLLQTARQLLESPDTVKDGPYYTKRPTTKPEKFDALIKKLIGLEPARPVDFFDIVVTETTTETIGVRGLSSEDAPKGAWGGGVYLEQRTVKNYDTGSEESLWFMYASATVNNPDASTESMAFINTRLWEVNLSEPILDPEQIAKLQSDLTAALERQPKP